MITRTARARSGITLTEILISILIMGIGLISLATLFPLGLLRLRDAARQSRSALLAESAFADMQSRNLLDKSSFRETYYQGTNNDPFLNDRIGSNVNATLLSGGNPVCYDPLWRSVAGVPPVSISTDSPPFLASKFVTNTAIFPAGSFLQAATSARFGFTQSLTASAGSNDNASPNSTGLQRISNFVPWTAATSTYPFTYANPNGVNPAGLRDMAVDTFVSQEDIVMQNDSPTQFLQFSNQTGTSSGVVPMMFPTATSLTTQNDWKYSWLFTGKQIDALDDTQIAGDIVIVENRQIGVESDANGNSVASSEFVVEAIFGAGINNPLATSQFFASGASRAVLLRWPATMPDLEIKIGHWFADVTYDPGTSGKIKNNFNTDGTTAFPMQRCYWYQVSKRSDVSATVVGGVAYRQMSITTTTPLRAQTLIDSTTAGPVFMNTALYMPGVINVFSRTFYVR